MRRILGLLLSILSVSIIIAAPAAAARQTSNMSQIPGSPYPSGQVGTDVSFPNCSAANPKSPFGIVGVTGGTGYSQNSCLKTQAGWYSHLSLYVNTGWYNQSTYINPNSPRQCAEGDQNCLAYNYGYNGGLYAFNYAATQSVFSPFWWLDVETENTWSEDTTQNRNSLQGTYDALKSKGATLVGAYSTTYQWNTITGNWQNGWPNWGATTWTKANQAAKYCKGHQFTGGPTYLIQFKGKLDQNYAC